MIKKLDGLLETVDYESSFLFIVHHNSANESYPKHWHSAVEIIMPVKSPYKVILNGVEHVLNEQDIFIIPSGELHELIPYSESGERIILQFDLSLFKTTESFLNPSYIFLKPNLITPNANPELHSNLKSVLLEILNEYNTKNNYYEASIISKIISLAIIVVRKQNSFLQDSEYVIKKKEHLVNFNKCIEYIGEHYKEDLTLDYISGIAGFSKYHFLRWFKQYAKMTFNDYLLQVRLKAAESLLLDFNIPITDVALESGFQSITTFNRVFKNNKKCTPTEYRNYNKNERGLDSKIKNKPSLETTYRNIDVTIKSSKITEKNTETMTRSNDIAEKNSEFNISEKYVSGKFKDTEKSDFFSRSINIVENNNNISETENNKIYISSCSMPSSQLLKQLLPVMESSSFYEIWSDIPEPDIIRVNNVYYMVGTCSHFSPDCPVMKSYDLINWDIISYVYNFPGYTDEYALKNNKNAYTQKGTVSLRYHNGVFYISFLSHEKENFYIFKSFDIEKNLWKKYIFNGDFRNIISNSSYISLFFDDDNKMYGVHGGYKFITTELILDEDEACVLPGSRSSKEINLNFNSVNGNYRINTEKVRIYKINGYYYILLSAFLENDEKHQVGFCFRSDKIDGSYEGQVVFYGNEKFNNQPFFLIGITDSENGDWYGIFSLERGASGKSLVYLPVKWDDGWPVISARSGKPRLPQRPRNIESEESFISSDEFYQNESYVPVICESISEYKPNVISKSGYLNDTAAMLLYHEILDNGNFKKGLNSWNEYEACNLSLKSDDQNSGKYILYVTGRTKTSSGPMQIITGKVRHGDIFKVSARIKYTSGPLEHVFNLTVKNGESSLGIHVMCCGKIVKGEWGIIEGTYTIPLNVNTSNTFIFIESAWNEPPSKEDDLMNFYVGSVSVVKKKIHGENIVIEGEYNRNGSFLSPQWQWNHNPDNNCWSLTERPGYLRLTTGNICDSLGEARNTLTQRTFGPVCSGSVAIETNGMKNMDTAGLAIFQKGHAYINAYIGVSMFNNKKYIVFYNFSSDNHSSDILFPGIPILNNRFSKQEFFTQERIYLKADLDYNNSNSKTDLRFYYSFDGMRWFSYGVVTRSISNFNNNIENNSDNNFDNNNDDGYDNSYDNSSTNNSGYRFALFNFARESIGGYVDFDYFRLDNKLTVNAVPVEILKADFICPSEVWGFKVEFNLEIKLEQPRNSKINGLFISLPVPEILEVTGVTFNGVKCGYIFKDNRLELYARGKTAALYGKSWNPFAEVRFKLKSYITQDTRVAFIPDYIYAESDSIPNEIKVTGENINAVYDISKTIGETILKYTEINAGAKKPGFSNPLINHKYGADPYALVYNGRLYIYLTSDAYTYSETGEITDNNYGSINTITAISTTDMVNWTDHGEIPVAGETGAAKWANHSWAPAIACKNIGGKDRFFLYFANDASNIGVLCSESPVGPWVDPLGKSLINRRIPGVENVTWCFDPAVLVDDDGSAYLYFGGGLPGRTEEAALHPKTARIIKLGDDMISVVGEAVMIDPPALFEDSGIHKFGGKYYYSYCSNFAGKHPEGYPPHGEIAYMVSDNPMGPFTYIGSILKNPAHFFGVGGNNHHAIFEFNGKWYITYHAATLGQALGINKGYRSPHINEIEFYPNGNIKDISADMKGVARLCNFDPYSKTSFATIAWCGGISTAALRQNDELNNANQVAGVHNNNWIAVSGLDFGESRAKTFTICAKCNNSKNGGVVEIHLDNHDGEIIGIVQVDSDNNDWNEISCDINSKNVNSVHDVFFVFKGEDEAELFDLDYWYFS